MGGQRVDVHTCAAQHFCRGHAPPVAALRSRDLKVGRHLALRVESTGAELHLARATCWRKLADAVFRELENGLEAAAAGGRAIGSQQVKGRGRRRWAAWGSAHAAALCSCTRCRQPSHSRPARVHRAHPEPHWEPRDCVVALQVQQDGHNGCCGGSEGFFAGCEKRRGARRACNTLTCPRMDHELPAFAA